MASEAETPIRLLGRYAICGTIGAGGMATVHVGRLLGPVGFSRTVAIKKMHTHLVQDPEFVTMFLEEARMAARVQHSNVVSTLDVVTESGELFHVMEYVEGEPLSKMLAALLREGKRAPLPVVGAIVSQALHGLHAVHESKGEDGRPLGLIHRDVSPDNILVGRDGCARVLDFGIAKASEHGRRTQAGKIKGKVAYMAPEHMRGKDIDRRADVFAASAVLWEALTGRRLVKGETDIEMIHSAISLKADAPSAFVPSLSREIDALVLRGLAPERDKRYPTAQAMALEVERILGVASPTTVAALVESTMGRELAKKAALVDSAVKLAARFTAQGVAAPATSRAQHGARDAGPFQAARKNAETLGYPGTNREEGPSSFALKGTEMMALPDLGEPASPREEIPKVPTLDLGPVPSRTIPLAAPARAAPPPAAQAAPSFEIVSGSNVRDDAPAPRGDAGTGALDVDFGAQARPGAHVPPAQHAPPYGQAPPVYGGPDYGPGYAQRTRPGGGGASPAVLVPVLIGCMIIVAVALVLLFRGTSSSGGASASAAPPSTPEEASACDTLRKRARSGGQPVGLSRAGWALELWLRGPGGKKIDVGAIDKSSLTGDAASKDTFEITKLSAPGKSQDEGVLIRVRGETSERAFDEEGSTKLVKAADKIFERTDAEAGALYLKCAHLPYHDVGFWFRGKDPTSASTSLLFAIALYADPAVIKEDALESADVRSQSSMFERLRTKLATGGTKDLDHEIQRYNGTVDEPAAGQMRITFPVTNLGASIRASRIVADRARVEQL